jgi:hypothetical protein
MVSLMQTMLDLHKQLADAKAEHERTMLKRQIEATDRQIDALVYELYGLTEEEDPNCGRCIRYKSAGEKYKVQIGDKHV